MEENNLKISLALYIRLEFTCSLQVLFTSVVELILDQRFSYYDILNNNNLRMKASCGCQCSSKTFEVSVLGL